MDNLSSTTLPAKSTVKSRRRYTAEFRSKIVNLCKQPGTSVAGIARENDLNANLVHRWIKAENKKSVAKPNAAPDFLSLPLTAPAAIDQSVRIEIGQVSIHWPITHINQAVPWLKALQS